MRLTTLHKASPDSAARDKSAQDKAAHEEGVWSTCWLPGSSKLLTGSVDESVKVWEDSADGLKCLHTYQGHSLGVVSVASNSTGEYAASSALDGFVRVWSLADHHTAALIEASTTETWSIAFSPQDADDLLLAVAGGTRGALVLWSIRKEEEGEGSSACVKAELMLPAGPEDRARRERFVLSVAYSPDGQRIACGAMDGTVAVFDTATGASVTVLEGHYKPVRSLVFMPDSRTLLTACDDMHINMYDVQNSSLIESFSGHGSWVLSVAAHHSGAAFVSGGSDAKVKLWDVGARACVQTVSEHSDQVWSVAYSSDGNRLASVSDDKSVATYGFSANIAQA